MLIPRHSEFRGKAKSKARNRTEWKRILRKNEVFRNLHSLSDHSDGLYILLWVVFSSAEFFGTEFREFASIFVPRNKIPSFFLFRWRVWKGIPRVCFYFGSKERKGTPRVSFFFCSTEWNSELFPLRGRVRNGIPRAFCSAEQPEFRRKKPFVSSIPSSVELFFVVNSQPYQRLV